jgi:hypothetical protein
VTKRSRWLLAFAALVLVEIAYGAAHAPPTATEPSYTHTDQAWDSLFQAYGNRSDAWSGGDGAQTLVLPDGSTMWFFADTFLGKTYPDGSRRAATTGNAHNSAVLYRDGRLGPTFSSLPGPWGYGGMNDYTWVQPPPGFSNSQFEVLNGDQVIAGSTVYKFFQLADKTMHPGNFNYKMVGTVVETFSVNSKTDMLTPTGGTPVGVQDSPGSNPIIWGTATLVAGGYVYIYGTRPYNRPSDPYPLYVARVPLEGLPSGAPWQYYHGPPSCTPPASAWQSSPQQASQLQTGVSAAFSVTDVNGTDVLLTNDDSDPVLSVNAVAYYAPCPTGFSPGAPRHPIFEPHIPRDYLAYAYQIVPQFSSGSEVLVSYSTDTVGLRQNFSNVSIYRPRFLDVRLPGIPGPAGHVIKPPP